MARFALLRVVKDDSERPAVAGTQPAHPMPHVYAVITFSAFHRPMMNRKNHCIALTQRNHFRARLHAGALLSQHKFATRKISPGHGEQERRLQREYVLAVEILM